MDYHLVQAVQLNALPRIKEVLNTPGARMAFLLMAIMMLAGFSVIPYISPYLVFNCGVSEDSLFLVYLIGGIFTFLASNVSGRLSDKLSPFKVFVWVTPLSVIPILMVTMLPAWPLSWILIVTTLFMALLSGRLIPIISLMTRTVEPNLRGTFMSLLASIQQSSAGIAAWIAGMMVTETPEGKLENYDRVGWMATGFSLFAIFITWKLIPLLKIGGQPAASPETIPSPNNHQSEDALHTIKVSEEQPQ
jgi:predicted MFS family arabinose efflux permease